MGLLRNRGWYRQEKLNNVKSFNIKKYLQKYPLIDYATIRNLLAGNGYKYINDKIKYMKQQGLLTSLKKGLYVYNSPYVKTLISKEIIANNLLGPSYISYEYALSYHGLTPERVEEVTSARFVY